MFCFTLLLGWTQQISIYPPSSIWFISNNVTETQEKLLGYVGSYYNCPIHVCRNGIESLKFRKSWLRRLSELNIQTDELIEEVKPSDKKEKLNKTNNDDDDDDDDEDDDDDDNDDDGYDNDNDDNDNDDNHNVRNNDNDDNDTQGNQSTDECNDFVANFLTGRKRKRNQNRKNQAKKLSKYPKIRPAKQFLSFQDRHTKNAGFIPQARKITSHSDKQRFKDIVGGKAVTRSSLSKNNQTETSHDNQNDKTRKVLTRSQTRKSADDTLNTSRLSSTHSSTADPIHPTPNPPSKRKENDDLSFQTEFKRRKKAADDESTAAIGYESVLIFDDLFSTPTNLSTSSKDAMKTLNQDYLRRLSFVKELFTEKNHLLRLEFSPTDQLTNQLTD